MKDKFELIVDNKLLRITTDGIPTKKIRHNIHVSPVELNFLDFCLYVETHSTFTYYLN